MNDFVNHGQHQYLGGCHCGDVRFRFVGPQQLKVLDCNCSICSMTGYLHVSVPHAAFELLTSTESLSEYRFGTGLAAHLHCRRCGIKSYYQPRSHPDCYSVNLRCIEGGTDHLGSLQPFDGRHWEQAAAQLRQSGSELAARPEVVEHPRMTERQYFGTDGIRGRVGVEPITAEFALKLGRAAGSVLAQRFARPKVLIGKDTRLSGYMLESALEAGLAAAGADVVLLGPMPTPAVAFLTRSQRASAGIVISASHNPYEDNGIKFFSADGEKLDDELEAAIEAAITAPSPMASPRDLGKASRLDDANGRYLEFLKSRLDRPLHSLQGMLLVIDCAHGAAYRIAPRLFEELGFQVTAIGDNPNGFNINAGFGATDLTALRAEVLRTGAALGLALDGDADRLMAISADGRLVDGDDLVYLLARQWQARGVLQGPVVGTVMTNLGMELALRSLGIGFERAAVGDRHVHQRLRDTGGILGGEASGHVICRNKASTGDGLMSALLLLEVLADNERPLGELAADLHRFPQRTINVRISGNARALLRESVIESARIDVVQALGDGGRLVLRASGTEPLIRVTVEARESAVVERHVNELAEVVKQAAAAQNPA